MEEIGKRHAPTRSMSGVRPDERQLLCRHRTPRHEADSQRVVVLGDVFSDVGQHRRIGDRGVPRDLGADRGEAFFGELRAARFEHLRDAVDRRTSHR
jgi:hypothetical protein